MNNVAQLPARTSTGQVAEANTVDLQAVLAVENARRWKHIGLAFALGLGAGWVLVKRAQKRDVS